MRVHEFAVNREIDRIALARISSQSSQFVSDIKLEYRIEENEYAIDVKSLLGMMSLPIHAGTVLRLVTKGIDEEEAMHAVFELFERES